MKLSHTMPFGKFRGIKLSDLPDWYLEWLSGWDALREPLYSRVLDELQRRSEGVDEISETDPLKIMAASIVRSGFREIALKLHPDRGGSNEDMMRCLEARELLQQLLEREST